MDDDRRNDNDPARIALGGGVVLERLADGRLVLRHRALSDFMEVDEAQLRRWALRQLREMTFA